VKRSIPMNTAGTRALDELLSAAFSPFFFSYVLRSKKFAFGIKRCRKCTQNQINYKTCKNKLIIVVFSFFKKSVEFEKWPFIVNFLVYGLYLRIHHNEPERWGR
jgi:hypothetical protein